MSRRSAGFLTFVHLALDRATFAGGGERAKRRFVEFFTANIRNPNTRAAYGRAVGDFFAWLDERGVTLERIEPVVVAAYVEQLGREKSAPTVKQALAAIRMLFDWMVVGQVLPMNPASSVRGPKHVVKRGKTPVLTAQQPRTNPRRDSQGLPLSARSCDRGTRAGPIQ